MHAMLRPLIFCSFNRARGSFGVSFNSSPVIIQLLYALYSQCVCVIAIHSLRCAINMCQMLITICNHNQNVVIFVHLFSGEKRIGNYENRGVCEKRAILFAAVAKEKQISSRLVVSHSVQRN
jgi:hypothetical protein